MAKSELVLGTVQLGMKYGLNNTHGQPSKEDSVAILDAAFASGIDTFDTAYAYGTAEDVLGDWISSRALGDKVSVISKMKPHALNDYPDGTLASDVVRMEIEKSLHRLHINALDGYLLHSPYYIYSKHVMASLHKAKASGAVRNIGVSTYDEDDALQAVQLGIDYIQVPYNVFDQRLDATDFFALAKKNNVIVFARSPFLQGLLLMEPGSLPPHLLYARPQLEQFIEITQRHRISRVEASLLFTHIHCPADRIVFGVETLPQLKETIAVGKQFSSSIGDSWVKEIVECFKGTDRAIVNQSLWNRIK